MTSDERMVTIAPDGEGEVLEGLFLSGPSSHGVVMAPPHPLYGGSMASPVVNEIAYAAGKNGLASLRFNWRGVGASAGERSGEAEHADADYRAALTHLAETVSGQLIVAGYSFGSVAALRAAAREPRVAGVVLVAPPPSYFPDDALRTLEAPCLVIAAEQDDIAPLKEIEARCATAPQAVCNVIEDADHFFSSGLGGVGRSAARWFERFGDG
jgi:alpha/beta superfamily hydrolase